MVGSEHERRMRAGAIFTHNMFATRADTKAEAQACRDRLLRARDLTLHGPATAIVQSELVITEAEYEGLRGLAVDAMRWGCRVCGRCAKHGLTSP